MLTNLFVKQTPARCCRQLFRQMAADRVGQLGERKKKRKGLQREVFSTWEFQYCHQLLYYPGRELLNCIVLMGYGAFNSV